MSIQRSAPQSSKLDEKGKASEALWGMRGVPSASLPSLLCRMYGYAGESSGIRRNAEPRLFVSRAPKKILDFQMIKGYPADARYKFRAQRYGIIEGRKAMME